jgi:hypothetical protein
VPRRGLGPVLQPGKLGRELLREQVAAGGQQLAQLGERHPARFQRTAQRRRERGPPAGRVRAVPPPSAQVRSQPVLHRDPGDLGVTPGTRERAPGAADQPDRLRPGPARDQHLGRHDEDHRDDQRNAQRHGEERGRVPGLGRPQQAAEEQGGREAEHGGDQRPQRPHRPPDHPPRHPRQAGDQHHAGDQRDRRETDPPHGGLCSRRRRFAAA